MHICVFACTQKVVAITLYWFDNTKWGWSPWRNIQVNDIVELAFSRGQPHVPVTWPSKTNLHHLLTNCNWDIIDVTDWNDKMRRLSNHACHQASQLLVVQTHVITPFLLRRIIAVKIGEYLRNGRWFVSIEVVAYWMFYWSLTRGPCQ